MTRNTAFPMLASFCQAAEPILRAGGRLRMLGSGKRGVLSLRPCVYVSATLILLFAGVSVGSAATLTSKVGAHPSVGMTQSTVNAAYRKGSKLLKDKDSQQDISCGGVTFQSANGSDLADRRLVSAINVQSDYSKAAKRGYKINFMRSIRVCGNVKGIIRGCKTGGRIYIVYPIRALETTLVHEYGHLNGLSHPPKRAEYAWRIMYFRYDPNRAGVTTFECTALTGDILEKYQEQKAFADIEAAEIIPDIAETEAEEILNPIVEDINEFLSEVWLHGTPVAQILTLDESQLSVVRKVVSQISDLDKLSNAITVLGIRGERSDVPALKDALFTLAGVNSPAGQEALLTVPIALGMIAGRTRSPEAMEVLENWVMSMGLQQLTINSGVSEQTLRENFIVGLAYTGTLSRSGSLSDIETAAERGLFEMQFDEGFSEYVRTLEGTILEKGVVESLR